MRKQSWTKRDPIKNYFPLPNEIYDLGLSRGAISVYSFLLRREDRKTYQCLLSYREIGEGVGMCVTTVRKYVAELEERSLIRTERTTVTTKDGRKRNGRLLYHILPIQLAIDQYYERQMDMADLALEKHKAKQRLAALEDVTELHSLPPREEGWDELQLTARRDIASELPGRLAAMGAELRMLYPQDVELEEIFMHLMREEG